MPLDGLYFGFFQESDLADFTAPAFIVLIAFFIGFAIPAFFGARNPRDAFLYSGGFMLLNSGLPVREARLFMVRELLSLL